MGFYFQVSWGDAIGGIYTDMAELMMFQTEGHAD